MNGFIAWTVILCLLLPTAHAVDPDAPTEITPEIEAALLKEDWAKVAELIGEVKPDAPAPLRVIMGHACLAQNRNNESVVLFLSTRDDDLRTLHAWASRFASEHSNEAAGQYFLGDSLARLGKYREAIEAFDAARKLRPNHPLVMNAQGVAYARLGRLSNARECFDGAIAASEAKLADAHANLGGYWIENREGAEGSEKSFTRAIALSSGFDWALHSRGYVRLVLNRKEDAKADFGLAYQGDRTPLQDAMDEEHLWVAANGPDNLADSVTAEARMGGAFFKREVTTDTLGASARNWAQTSRALDTMGWLPCNQRLAEQARGIVRDRLKAVEKIGGNDAIRTQVAQNRSLIPTVAKSLNEGARTGTENAQFASRQIRNIETIPSAEKDLFKAFSALPVDPKGRYTLFRVNVDSVNPWGKKNERVPSDSLVSHTATCIYDENAKKVVACGSFTDIGGGSFQHPTDPRNLEGATRAVHLNREQGKWSAKSEITGGPEIYAKFKEVYRDAVMAPPGFTGIYNCKGNALDNTRAIREELRTTRSAAGGGSGGADMSMTDVEVDDGAWPFRPLYGLVYGMAHPSDVSSEATATNRSTKTEVGDGE